ncbi:MAG: YlzJ-like family protein [Firmicutes bacterium]|nr:YlzJ-like family protein [Dethiobacter sp.]MBS3888704.1 YlzJ-like family protein [Bacillota bacterium]
MIYSIVPPEVIFAENIALKYPEEVVYLGKRVLVQPMDDRTCQIIQLLSSSPSDFLLPAFSPGNIITLHT